ncbi:MAG TPA: M20/M25/M40 family metallo-hydrolase [Anaerolineae bacterium]|nr:M20/M25/M40 family metallo-hydrolase [Anaerolineae bacterium]
MNIDWPAVGNEAAALLGEYLRTRTVNPPGNERLAADYLQAQLHARGFETTLWEAAPGRANLMARLKGDASQRPVILLHHMDVVAADRERWSVDPFGGEIRDGFVWGRGALDMKGAGIMHLLAMDLLKRKGIQLRRDVVLLAVSDEEVDSSHGVSWLLSEHQAELDAEYVWDEGGFGLEGLFGKRVLFSVAVTEKGCLWLRLVVEGEPGHGGVPKGGNPVELLVAALERVRRHRWPVRLHPVAGDFFRVVAGQLSWHQRWLLQNLQRKPVLALASRALGKQPALKAMLQNTVSLTGTRAGVKENVIPERAEATLDVRLLPGEDVSAFLAELGRVASEPRLRIETIQAPEPATVTPYQGDAMFAAMERVCQRLVPGCLVAPMLSPGTTDSQHLRRHGVKTFGLFPAVISTDELARFHGIDERISVANLTLGTRMVYEVLRELCADPNSGQRRNRC